MVVIVVFSYMLFGTAFAGFILYSILYLAIPKNKHYDFIIIHGAGLKNGESVTPLLKKRIDKAIDAFRQSSNPGIKIIASGGRGSDEKISEAQAIANYIAEETDVPMDKVILEDKSTTTYENLLFSKKLGEALVDSPRFLFVTNNYHVYRTGAYAKTIGMLGDGLGCNTASYYIPSAFIREFIAICVKIKWVFIAFYALFFLMLAVSYLGRNL
ncbi:YdcF family protein [Mogibacterium sp. CM50]|nr:YdcF family protein [Mogibacterium sp. CM50]